MRLTVKLVLWFFVPVVLAVAVNAFYGVRAELERFEADVAARHVVMGRVLRAAFSEVLDTDGETRAVSVLDYTDKRIRLVDIRWVHLEPGAPSARVPAVSLDRLAPLRLGQDVHEKADGRLRSYVPLFLQDRPLSALELSESLDSERAVVGAAVFRELRAVAAIAIAIGVVAAGVGGVLVGHPVRLLVEHARRVGSGDFSIAAVPRRSDELADLAREMNAMCLQLGEAHRAKLRAIEQLRHADRLTTVGKLASGLAHELGTPLNVITLRARSIAQGRAEGERAVDAARSIAEQATRMTNLVRQLLDFARPSTPLRTLIDVREVIARSVDLVAPVAAKARIRVETDVAPGLPALRANGPQLEQVLTNLLVNAVHSMPDGGTVRISADAPAAASVPGSTTVRHDLIRLSVKDEGTGIAEENLAHLFEPFFTTKEVGVGTGLGLAVCYGIVRDHGGFIDVVSTVGEGSTFSVHLPKDRS